MDKEAWHGTPGGYSNHKCRCPECRLAWNGYSRKLQARRRASGRFDGIEHGGKAYDLGCRCQECKTANALRSSQRRILKHGGHQKPEDGLCECCRKLPRSGLNLDHDHATGEFRGWLCHSCNTGIGKLGDSVEGLEQALAYLRGA